jgi:hypothetical protein
LSDFPTPTSTLGHSPVTVAVSAVMAALPAIGKDSQAAQQQGGYAYRGIEQITAQCQRLFAEHGVVFAPRVTGHEIRDITVANKPWTDTILTVEYDVYGPAGDHITVGPILAIGRDNSDKGANKAMTQAFKYALLQTLCISDAKDDGDGHTHEADSPPPPPPPAWSTARAKSLLVEQIGKDAATACWTANVADGDPLPSEDEVLAMAGAWPK